MPDIDPERDMEELMQLTQAMERSGANRAKEVMQFETFVLEKFPFYVGSYEAAFAHSKDLAARVQADAERIAELEGERERIIDLWAKGVTTSDGRHTAISWTTEEFAKLLQLYGLESDNPALLRKDGE